VFSSNARPWVQMGRGKGAAKEKGEKFKEALPMRGQRWPTGVQNKINDFDVVWGKSVCESGGGSSIQELKKGVCPQKVARVHGELTL